MMDCYICEKTITGKYYVDGWDHKICESHLNNEAVFCSSCKGFTKKEHILPDGRILCYACMSIAIKPNDSIELIKKSVINALNKVGFDDLRMEDISIETTSAQKMADIRQSPVNLQNKGLTLSKTTSSISFGFFNGKGTSRKFKHTIYMLTHLTKIEFAGTLAHEMLHAWQVQNGIQMSPKMTERLCNMGTYLMYNTLSNSLTKRLLNGLHESTDPIYGDGFREVHAHFQEWGWSELIRNVREDKLV